MQETRKMGDVIGCDDLSDGESLLLHAILKEIDSLATQARTKANGRHDAGAWGERAAEGEFIAAEIRRVFGLATEG